MIPLTEIFCFIDDFCKTFEQNQSLFVLPNPDRNRQRRCQLCLSEIMTILVMFQFSGYRTFKDFYLNCMSNYKSEFPQLVSYTRFLQLKGFAFMPLFVLLQWIPKAKTGKYFIDSTKLEVCHNLRISRDKVFKDCAKRGKTSTGWFFGFKLHLVINSRGEIMRFALTPGNTDDRAVVEKMMRGLKGWLFGDRGYISAKLLQSLKIQGIELLTKLRKGMKEREPLTFIQKFYLNKRNVVETIIGQLKSIFHVQQTRHRSPINFQVNVLAALLAYAFKPRKASVQFHQLNLMHQKGELTSS